MISGMTTNDVVKPSIFVGSSKEGLPVAKAVQYRLAQIADTEIWNEGAFGLTYGTLESLVQILDRFEFAILVLTPDDLVVSRGERQNGPRDNLLLELGLFMGKLGRAKTFVLYPRNKDLKLPSDLAGVAMAAFDDPDDPTRLVNAIGPACYQIEVAIQAFSRDLRVPQLQSAIRQQGALLQEQQRRLDEQQDMINSLAKYSIADHVFVMLDYCYRHVEYRFWKDDANQIRSLHFLLDHGYVQNLDINLLSSPVNLSETIVLTPAGRLLVELRDRASSAQR
jgi:hypothetical protein